MLNIITNYLSVETTESCDITFDAIYKYADFIGILFGIVVSVTTLVILAKTYFLKNIKVLNWVCSTGMFDGSQIGLAIQNRSLATVSIDGIYLILDNKQRFIIKHRNPLISEETEKPLILKPFQSAEVFSDYYTEPILAKEKKYSLASYDLKLLVVFSDRSFKYFKHKHKPDKSYKYTKKYELIKPQKKTINGVIVTDYVKYVVGVIDSSGVRHIYKICEKGEINEPFYGITHIPVQYLKDSDTLKEYLLNISGKTYCSIEVCKNDIFKARGKKVKYSISQCD